MSRLTRCACTYDWVQQDGWWLTSWPGSNASILLQAAAAKAFRNASLPSRKALKAHSKLNCISTRSMCPHALIIEQSAAIVDNQHCSHSQQTRINIGLLRQSSTTQALMERRAPDYRQRLGITGKDIEGKRYLLKQRVKLPRICNHECCMIDQRLRHGCFAVALSMRLHECDQQMTKLPSFTRRVIPDSVA